MNIAKGKRFKHYEILSRLGAGGMGEVYLAEDKQLGRKVAIKILSKDSAGDEAAEKRLLKEARAAAKLDHPNICAIYEVGEEGDFRFIVLQYIEGETLAARMKRRPLDLPTALAIAGQVAEALAEAHARGIVHRDIKPENVMIAARDQVKVLDFGLAKVLRDTVTGESEAETATQLSVPGIVMGTLPYMSPEQVRGEELDSRSDIFSFGTMLYEMLNGRRPFDAGSKAEVISAILTREPPALESRALSRLPKLEWLTRKCLEKDASRRYQTMPDLIVDLDQIRRESENGRSTTVPMNRTPRPVVSRRAFVLIAIAIVAAALYWLFLRTPGIPLSPGAKSINSPAYDDYIRGMVKVSNQNRESNDEAIQLLEKAVAIDPNFAPAYAELARAYNVKAFFFASGVEKKQVFENAEVAVQKALALDPDLAEAHYARGLILFTREKGFPFELAIQSFKKALALNPNLDEAHHQLAVVYLHIGLLDEAWAEVEKTLAINPDNTLARLRFGIIDLYRTRYEDAISIFKSIPREASPTLRDRAMATALFDSGRIEEAAAMVEEFLKTYPTDEGGAVTSVKAMLLARTGKAAEAEDAIKRTIEIGKDFGHFHHSAYNIGTAYTFLHKPEQAIQWLQAAADDGFPCYPYFEKDANLNSLRKDERFIAFMAKLKAQWERYRAAY